MSRRVSIEQTSKAVEEDVAKTLKDQKYLTLLDRATQFTRSKESSQHAMLASYYYILVITHILRS